MSLGYKLNKYIGWCLEQARLAMLNYDQPAALNYIEMAGVWNRRDLV